MVVLGSLSAASLAPVLAAAPHYILPVVNPVAGSGNAPTIAENVTNVMEADRALQQEFRMLPPVRTVEDPFETVRLVAAAVRQFKTFRPDTPLDVIAFGGDGTMNEVVRGLLLYIFPNQQDMIQQSADEVAARMAASGLRVGVIRLGSANDLSVMAGAPGANESDCIDYLRSHTTVPLNLGWLELDGINEPIIFSHNAGAGTTIAAMFKSTRTGHGKWVHIKRKMIGGKNVVLSRPFHVNWKHSQYGDHQFVSREVFFHGTPLADGSNAFPGTPIQGLGVKGYPLGSIWQMYKIFREVQGKGKAALKGKSMQIGPDDRIERLEAELQLQLLQGQSMEIFFSDEKGQPFAIPVQVDGDYVIDTTRMIVRALPAWPAMRVAADCLLDRHHQRNKRLSET